MLYYKALRDTRDYFTGHNLIQGELLTEKERNRRFRYLSDLNFEKVNIKKNDTVFIFGCRYQTVK